MHTTVRPWLTTGIAIVGASLIAVAPVVPPTTTVPAPHVRAAPAQWPAVQLQASVVDIFTFPVLRQWATNLVLDYGTYAVALAESGANIGRAIGAIPETIVLLGQQLLSGDFQGALTTIETAVFGTIAAVGAPVLDAFITVRQRVLARQSELQAAVPAALIGVGTSFLLAVDGVLRASITGGQLVVDSLLPLDLGTLANAVVEAGRLFAGSFVDGGQDIVDGIVFAQQSIADALAAQPPTEEADTFSVTSVPDLGVDDTTMTLSTNADVAEQDSADHDDVIEAAAATDTGDEEETEATGDEDETETDETETVDETETLNEDEASPESQEPASTEPGQQTDNEGAEAA